MGQVVGQLGAGQFCHGHFLGRRHLLPVGKGFRGDALGYADYRRHGALDDLVAGIGDALGNDGVGFGAVVQLPHLADVGQAQQFGQLRANLAGLGVAAVAPADDKVGPLPLQSQAQGAGGSQGVGTGQSPVGQQNAAVGAEGHAGNQSVLSLGRPHTYRHHLVGRAGFQFDGAH